MLFRSERFLLIWEHVTIKGLVDVSDHALGLHADLVYVLLSVFRKPRGVIYPPISNQSLEPLEIPREQSVKFLEPVEGEVLFIVDKEQHVQIILVDLVHLAVVPADDSVVLHVVIMWRFHLIKFDYICMQKY